MGPHDNGVDGVLVDLRQDFFMRNPASDSGDGLRFLFDTPLRDRFDGPYSLFSQLIFDREPFRLWQGAVFTRVDHMEGLQGCTGVVREADRFSNCFVNPVTPVGHHENLIVHTVSSPPAD